MHSIDGFVQYIELETLNLTEQVTRGDCWNESFLRIQQKKETLIIFIIKRKLKNYWKWKN